MRARGKWLAVAFLALGGSSAQAALTYDELTSQLIAQRDGVASDLSKRLDAQVADNTKTEGAPAPFAEFAKDMPGKWDKVLEGEVNRAKTALHAWRLAVADRLSEDAERTNRVSVALKAGIDARVDAMTKARETVKTDLTTFAATDAGKDATKVAEKLKELDKKITSELSADAWAGVVTPVLAAHKKPSADEQLAAADKSLQTFLDRIEKDFETRVICEYGAKDASLRCGKSLALSAARISAIEITGLPADRPVTITAASARDGVALASGGTPIVPEVDSITLPARTADRAMVNVYLYRYFKPTYQAEVAARGTTAGESQSFFKRSSMNSSVCDDIAAASGKRPLRQAEAACALREGRGGGTGGGRTGGDASGGGSAPNVPLDQQLYLIVSSRAPQILLQLKIGEGDTSTTSSASVRVGYARWSADAGGFIAASNVTDPELLTVPGASGKVKVLRTDAGSSTTTETGIMVNLAARNYPFFGVGVGFSVNDEKPLSVYLGPTIRLLSFEDKLVASFSLGVTLRSVKHFPGVEQGQEYAADSPLLTGRSRNKAGIYGLVQLGFKFGPVPGT